MTPPDRLTHSDPERSTQKATATATTATTNGKDWRSNSDGGGSGGGGGGGGHAGVSRTSQTAGDGGGGGGGSGGGGGGGGGDAVRQLYAQYADVMYTNEANLAHTMRVQQQLFQQQRAALQADGGPVYEELPGEPAAAVTDNQAGRAADVEWVVKKRSDGSRYITRRPVRASFLRERARHVAAQRGGTTTDDDAVSELKVGRYWRRDERRGHVERARDHRRRKQELVEQRHRDGEAERRDARPDAVQLGHRKMMRHKGRRILDDFMTIQEMLAHGTRDSSKAYNPLLSVTTV